MGGLFKQLEGGVSTAFETYYARKERKRGEVSDGSTTPIRATGEKTGSAAAAAADDKVSTTDQEQEQKPNIVPYIPRGPPTYPVSTLSRPIIIPQRYPGDFHYGFVATYYPPELEDMDIPQDEFERYLRAINSRLEQTPALRVVTVAARLSTLAPSLIAMAVGGVAARASQTVDKGKATGSTNVFIQSTNESLWAPRNLAVHVVTEDVLIERLGVDAVRKITAAQYGDHSAEHDGMFQKLARHGRMKADRKDARKAQEEQTKQDRKDRHRSHRDDGSRRHHRRDNSSDSSSGSSAGSSRGHQSRLSQLRQSLQQPTHQQSVNQQQQQQQSAPSDQLPGIYLVIDRKSANADYGLSQEVRYDGQAITPVTYDQQPPPIYDGQRQQSTFEGLRQPPTHNRRQSVSYGSQQSGLVADHQTNNANPPSYNQPDDEEIALLEQLARLRANRAVQH